MFSLYPPKLPLDSEVLSPAAKITDETLEKLSPAVVIVCGRDPLHPQGEHYARLLEKHGKQDKLREDCFRYKVEKAKELYAMRGEKNHGKAENA